MTVHSSIENGVARIVLSEPPLNILTRQALADLRDELKRLQNESGMRVLVLSAEGKHFSAGADVGEHLPPHFHDLIPEFIATVRALSGFPLPVIAAVQGRCLGGGFELVQAADIIIAGEGASFGQPEIMLGVLPPGACVLLPELCAPGVAAELVYTGDAITAQEAERVGIVRRVVPDAEIEQAALELASRIARHSGAALRLAKRGLRQGQAASRSAALGDAGRIYVEELMQTEDAVSGLRAFIEKQEPVWSHR